MSREIGRRVWLSIAIPLGAVIFIAVMLWAFSRVLLAVPTDLAPVVALLFAMDILVASALAAILRGRRSFQAVVAVMVVTVLAAGVVGQVVGEEPVHSLVAHEGEPEGEPTGEPTAEPTDGPTEDPTEGPTDEPTDEPTEEPPGGGAVTLVAQNSLWDQSEISLPAETTATVTLENLDPLPHNFSIYTEPGGDEIFSGGEGVVDGTIDYEVETPEPGEYFFQCDFHPTTMQGTVVVG